MSDITLVNLNMLYVRYVDNVERELHVPLGPLYLTSALEKEGFDVNFRDYQLCEAEDPFLSENILDFLKDPAEVVGFSCMANLLPFTILAIEQFRERYPDRKVILGGVGATSVERKILERFPWIDIIARGESERTIGKLIRSLNNGHRLKDVPGLSFRRDGKIIETPLPERIKDLDSIGFPAWHKVDLSVYEGYGVISSRGCPYPCTFCSVAPIWGLKPYYRSSENIVEEMKVLNEEAGVDLFLFQDEFFVSSKERVLDFCKTLKKSGLDVRWKAFGRVNLTDRETMEAMASTGCIEIRYGIESGSAKVLERTKKGFSPEQSTEVVSEAVQILPRVDCFFMWGFPFETMDDFYQTVFQMTAFRQMGARILPSLLCLLPQTELYKEYEGKVELEFCEYLFPEYMVTGHEVCDSIEVSVKDEHKHFYDFISENRDIFPGFFHIDLENNIFPKLEVLKEFGFYRKEESDVAGTDSCGAHSPRVGQATSPAQLTVR